MKEKRIIGFYDYTVILTYCGMLFSFLGILLSISDEYFSAVVCLLLAGICDMFDGAVASTRERTDREKCFGIQIDSLSDLISFGVFPGIFSYRITGNNRVTAVIAALYTLCALIRLAYFNVQEAERQATTGGRRESYLGVPVTTIALLLPLVFILVATGIVAVLPAFSIMLAITAIGFVAGIHIKKPKTVGKVIILVIGFALIGGLIAIKCKGLA